MPADRPKRTRDRRFREEEEAYLGPVAVAMFIDFDWLREWPMAWTASGRRAARNGYGEWRGRYQPLPRHLWQKPGGAPDWPGRRVKPPEYATEGDAEASPYERV